MRPPSCEIATNVRYARLVSWRLPVSSLLGIDIDLRFERCREDARHARLQDDQVSDLDRVQELQAVDGGRHQQSCACAGGTQWRPRCR